MTTRHLERRLVAEADVVYVGNAEIANRLRPLRADVVEAWCPGILVDAKPFEPAELSVFTFGMAHKVRGEYYRKLDRSVAADRQVLLPVSLNCLA